METTHTAASTYVQISREELEDWLDDIGFRGKWARDARFAGVYLLFLSDSVAVKLGSTIGSKDDAMGRGQASMQLALVSRVTGKVLNKKAQGQSHFARTKGWMRNWAAGVATMKSTYQTAADFYDVIATIDDRDKYREELLKKIETIPGWATNNFFINLHRKVDRGGVVMPNETREIDRALAVPARPDPQKTPPVSSREPPPPGDKNEDEAKMIQADMRDNAVRALWEEVNDFQPRDEQGQKNKEWVLQFAQSVGAQIRAGRTLSPAQVNSLRRNLDQWGIKLPSGKLSSTLF